MAESLSCSPESNTHCSLTVQFSSVQLLSRVQLFATPWISARQASLSITNSPSPLKPMSIKSVMPSNHLILCRPLLLLPPIPPSIRVFSNESTLHMRWPKYWSFSFSVSPSNEHPGLISFRMDGLDLLAVQGTLKSLLQHHTSRASIFQRSAFFTLQLSHPYMTTGKTIALTRWTFVGKVMSLLFNIDCMPIQNWAAGSEGKESACNLGDPGSILGSGRSPKQWNSNPLQYSCLENSMDRGAWHIPVIELQRVGPNWVTNTFFSIENTKTKKIK